MQETFDAGLQAFEKEGIQTITTLKDQLVNARHAQTPAIERRYNDVIARYLPHSVCLSLTHSSSTHSLSATSLGFFFRIWSKCEAMHVDIGVDSNSPTHSLVTS